MSLPVPKLDDRHFQDLVDEAKKRIPHYTKEWTDHNVSDPGVTLVELFAFMTDVLLYRLNQVPDLHYVRFLEMLGVRLKPPQPASVPVTFWLSAPQPTPIVIPSRFISLAIFFCKSTSRPIMPLSSQASKPWSAANFSWSIGSLPA